MIVNKYTVKNTYLGRFDYGADLHLSIEQFIISNNIKMGTIQLIGAVQKANLGYYNPQTTQYESIAIDKQLEIASGIGNISMRDGQPMAHVHLTVSDNTGRCYAGHLLEGNIIFVSEFIITELDGPIMERKADSSTGVTLWSD